MARHGLYDAAFQQVVMLCQTIAPGFGDSVRELRNVHSSLLTELQHSFCEVANDNVNLSNELTVLQNAASTMQNDVVSLQDTLQTLNAENEDYKKRVLELRKNLREATQQVTILKEAVANNPKTMASTAINGPNNAANASASNLLSFNNYYLSNTLDFETNTLQQFSPESTSQGMGQRKRSSSVTPTMRSSGGAGDNSANNNANHNSSSSRLRRSGSNGNFNASQRSLTSALPGEWNASTKDSAIKDDWMNDAASVSNSVLSSPSRVNKNNTILNAAQKGGLSIVAPVNWLLIFRAEVQKALDEGRCREMTVNEVTETIQKLYQSKVIANEKASRGIGNVPLETMEQHVFRTYEAKYGLRSIAVEHAGALLRSLLKHSSTDNEVMVFFKIFRNELEEEFRFIQSELFTSIKDLTMVQMLSRFPNKDQSSINALLEQKMSNGFVYEDEWMDMVNYLYNPTDASTVCVLLKNLAAAERAKVGYFDSPGGVNKAPLSANSNKGVSHANAAYVLESQHNQPSTTHIGYSKQNHKDVKRLGYASPTLQITVKESLAEKRKDMYKVPFAMFLRTVLDFQLQSHLQYLNNFVRVFRDMDTDVDGVINAAEFKECFLLIRRSNSTAPAVSGSSKNKRRDANQGVSDAVTEEEMKDFLALIVDIDPMQTDRITFSSAVTCLIALQYSRWKLWIVWTVVALCLRASSAHPNESSSFYVNLDTERMKLRSSLTSHLGHRMELTGVNRYQENYYFTNQGYHTFVVPYGVTLLSVSVLGARGGGVPENLPGTITTAGGGLASVMFAQISVSPGQTYYLFVGRMGSATTGGYNGGGAPVGTGFVGGGGASDIRTSLDLSSRIIVAAGGGGAGATASGNTGVNTKYCSYAVSAGTFGKGGNGCGVSGSGGGGGYYGGAGGYNAGGGGGSSFITAPATMSSPSLRYSGGGYITVAYNRPYPDNSVFFNYNGAFQTYTVPAGVSNLWVELHGAWAGCKLAASGGMGGMITAVLPVTPGEVLRLYVGGSGGEGTAGFNGGGLPSAGFGGNGGYPNGLPGIMGIQCNGWYGGNPGTQTAGGTYGSSAYCVSSTSSGSLGEGGDGCGTVGSGGGGGYYGGASGYFSGGGGGSSYSSVAGFTYQNGENSQNGYAVISANLDPTAQPTFTPAPTFAPTWKPSAKPTFNPSANPTIKPTTAPSFAPTKTPSAAPTASPSFAPSIKPTIKPSASPTRSPTINPTPSPSFAPSVKPTAAPTRVPSTAPTTPPTYTPTIRPSASPSFAPSAVPTVPPTRAPTATPSTAKPTCTPTIAPSASPSFAPSVIPTAVPTRSPTLSPSAKPSFSPTALPSAAPTFLPTVNPSAGPTRMPTAIPTTAKPTCNPTANPTVSPSFAPTVKPSVAPSRAPSVASSANPSPVPTMKPSASPTFMPTVNPSACPTRAPTAMPTTPKPTCGPTANPSASPSFNPTLNPSAGPTRIPSTNPTAAPSCAPTVKPSASPSFAPTATPSALPTRAPTATALVRPDDFANGQAVPVGSTNVSTDSHTVDGKPFDCSDDKTKRSAIICTNCDSHESSHVCSDGHAKCEAFVCANDCTKRGSIIYANSDLRSDRQAKRLAFLRSVRGSNKDAHTAAPSDPSVPPSAAPSDPTLSPSAAPNHPSVPPSAAPSDPSVPPSAAPNHPSLPPSIFPSGVPVVSPTWLPSRRPTLHPTPLSSQSPTVLTSPNTTAMLIGECRAGYFGLYRDACTMCEEALQNITSTIASGGSDSSLSESLHDSSRAFFPQGFYCPAAGTVQPLASPGWYVMYESVPSQRCSANSQKQTSVCPVAWPCDPPESCLGLNVCDTLYGGERCAECASGMLRVNDSCVSCDATYYGLLLLALFLLCTEFISPSTLLSLLCTVSFTSQTPTFVETALNALSVLNLNPVLLLSSCLGAPSTDPETTFRDMFIVVNVLPLMATVLLYGLSKLRRWETRVFLLVIAAVLSLLYCLLLATSLSVFDCTVTTPDDGFTYLAVFGPVMQGRCGVADEVQETLVSFAILCGIVHGLGIPLYLFGVYKYILRAAENNDRESINGAGIQMTQRQKLVFGQFSLGEDTANIEPEHTASANTGDTCGWKAATIRALQWLLGTVLRKGVVLMVLFFTHDSSSGNYRTAVGLVVVALLLCFSYACVGRNVPFFATIGWKDTSTKETSRADADRDGAFAKYLTPRMKEKVLMVLSVSVTLMVLLLNQVNDSSLCTGVAVLLVLLLIFALIYALLVTFPASTVPNNQHIQSKTPETFGTALRKVPAASSSEDCEIGESHRNSELTKAPTAPSARPFSRIRRLPPAPASPLSPVSPAPAILPALIADASSNLPASPVPTTRASIAAVGRRPIPVDHSERSARSKSLVSNKQENPITPVLTQSAHADARSSQSDAKINMSNAMKKNAASKTKDNLRRSVTFDRSVEEPTKESAVPLPLVSAPAVPEKKTPAWLLADASPPSSTQLELPAARPTSFVFTKRGSAAVPSYTQSVDSGGVYAESDTKFSMSNPLRKKANAQKSSKQVPAAAVEKKISNRASESAASSGVAPVPPPVDSSASKGWSDMWSFNWTSSDHPTPHSPSRTNSKRFSTALLFSPRQMPATPPPPPPPPPPLSSHPSATRDSTRSAGHNTADIELTTPASSSHPPPRPPPPPPPQPKADQQALARVQELQKQRLQQQRLMRFAAPSKNADANASEWSSAVNRTVEHPATQDEETEDKFDNNNDNDQSAARGGVKMVIGRDFRKKASTRLSKRFQTLRDAPYRKRSY
eukprot:gene11294-13139_t